MDPVRRLILDLSYEGRADDDGAGDHDDEYGGTVAGIRKGEIEAARFAIGFQRRNPSKSFPLPQRGRRHNNPVR